MLYARKMFVFELIVEILFSRICGWVGHFVVKFVTFGKVDLEWGDSSESVIAESIGAGIIIVAAILIGVCVSLYK
jgi:hypothetical protein